MERTKLEDFKWEEIESVILETIDRMIVHQSTKYGPVYALMKAALLDLCEELYFHHFPERKPKS